MCCRWWTVDYTILAEESGMAHSQVASAGDKAVDRLHIAAAAAVTLVWGVD